MFSDALPPLGKRTTTASSVRSVRPAPGLHLRLAAAAAAATAPQELGDGARRAAADAAPPAHAAAQRLLAQLSAPALAPLPLVRDPLPLLAIHPPALRLAATLLPRCLAVPRADAGLGLGVSLRAIVLHAAALGPLPDAARVVRSPREAAAIAFVQAAAASPAAISVVHRRNLTLAYSDKDVQHIALVAAFAGFYATIASLLGLVDRSCSSPAYERARASLNFTAESMSIASSSGSTAGGGGRGGRPDRDIGLYENYDDETDVHDVGDDDAPSLSTFSFRRLRMGSGGGGHNHAPSSGKGGDGDGGNGPGRHGNAFGAASTKHNHGKKDSSSKRNVGGQPASLRFRSNGNRHGHDHQPRSLRFPPGHAGSGYEAGSSATAPASSPFAGEKGAGANNIPNGKRFGRAGRSSATSRLTAPFKLLSAARALRAEENEWLETIPVPTDVQDRYLESLCGFVPEYVHQVRAPDDRRAIVFAIAYLCDADGQGEISALLRHLMTYILAKAAENPVLSAHAAFIANRYGASTHHLHTASDYALLLDCRDEYRRLRNRAQRLQKRTPSSTITSSSSGGQAGASHGVRRNRSGTLVDKFDTDDFNNCSMDPFPYVVAEESSSDEENDFDVKYTPAKAQSSRPSSVGGSVVPNAPILSNRDASHVVSAPIVTLEDLERAQSECSSLSEGSDDDEFADGFQVSSSESDSDGDNFDDDEDTGGVPGRGGVHRQNDNDDKIVYEDREQRGLPKLRTGSKTSARIPLPKPDRSTLKAAMWLYSERDVALLLFAHQAARSAKRTSRAELHSVGHMELSTDDTEFLTETLSPSSIIEAVTVIAVHVLLLRFVSIYQYRAGALENAVRRFAQGPVGYDLNVRSVGQRSTSRLDSDFGAGGTSSLRPASYLPRRMMSSL
jgi:hypothetical protein